MHTDSNVHENNYNTIGGRVYFTFILIYSFLCYIHMHRYSLLDGVV